MLLGILTTTDFWQRGLMVSAVPRRCKERHDRDLEPDGRWFLDLRLLVFVVLFAELSMLFSIIKFSTDMALL